MNHMNCTSSAYHCERVAGRRSWYRSLESINGGVILNFIGNARRCATLDEPQERLDIPRHDLSWWDASSTLDTPRGRRTSESRSDGLCRCHYLALLHITVAESR